MPTVKIGSIEGEPEDIRSVFVDLVQKSESLGIEPNSTTKLKSRKLHSAWIWMTVSGFFVCTFCLMEHFTTKTLYRDLEILLMFLLLGIAISLVQFKTGDLKISFIVLLFGTMLALLGLGSITPEQAAKEIKEMIPKFNEKEESNGS